MAGRGLLWLRLDAPTAKREAVARRLLYQDPSVVGLVGFGWGRKVPRRLVALRDVRGQALPAAHFVDGFDRSGRLLQLQAAVEGRVLRDRCADVFQAVPRSCGKH